MRTLKRPTRKTKRRKAPLNIKQQLILLLLLRPQAQGESAMDRMLSQQQVSAN